eukprot:Rmarinus@m.2833
MHYSSFVFIFVCCLSLPSMSTSLPIESFLNEKKIQFGHDMRALFSFEDGYTNVNHGSYGSVPQPIFNAHMHWQDVVEKHPDRWFRTQCRDEIRRVRADMAEYVNADKENLVFVENASTGVNTVLKSLPFEDGDVILYLNLAYPMVKNVLSYLVDDSRFQQTLHMVNVSMPLTGDEDVLSPVRSSLEELGAAVKLCVIDHIVSVPGVVLPVYELGKLCKDRGIPVLVDGAHALGQVPINLEQSTESASPPLGDVIDFYVSNAHKWFYTPRGAAIFWVSPQYQELIRPLVISSEVSYDFVDDFQYTGTRDYTAYVVMSDAKRFRESLGDAEIMEYNHDLAIAAVNHLASTWGTERLAPDHMEAALANVRLPAGIATMDDAKGLESWMMEKYNVFMVVYATEIDNRETYWLRISAQIFLELQDFELLGKRVLEYVESLPVQKA